MGNQHVQPGDKVTYPVCPPASGKHINTDRLRPAPAQGLRRPTTRALPNGWVHNLEHGGLVLLYSCDKGACDDALDRRPCRRSTTASPPARSATSSRAPSGRSSRRFEQMPTKYAALVWDRALYLDTLDTQKIYDFFLALRASGSPRTAPGSRRPSPSAPSPAAQPAGRRLGRAGPQRLGRLSGGSTMRLYALRGPVRRRRGSASSSTGGCSPAAQLARTSGAARSQVDHASRASAPARLEDDWQRDLERTARRARQGRGAAATLPGRAAPAAGGDRLPPRRSCASASTTATTRARAAVTPRTGRCCSPSSRNAIVGDGEAIVRPPGHAAPSTSRWSWAS